MINTRCIQYIYTSRAEKQNKTKKSTYLKSLTREASMHIRNAQGSPLISVFDLVSGFNTNFSFTLNFSFQKNVMKTLSLGVSDLLLARWIYYHAIRISSNSQKLGLQERITPSNCMLKAQDSIVTNILFLLVQFKNGTIFQETYSRGWKPSLFWK